MVLSGCREGTMSTAGADCTTPGVTRNQVNVGLIYPDSGVTSNIFTAFRSGIDARFGAANAAGGINGRHLIYTLRSDEARASVNLSVSRELVEQAKVFGILEGSIVASGGADYLAKAEIPVVGLASEKVWAKYRNMFTFAYNFPDGAVDTFGKFVKERGGTRALIFYNGLDATLSTPLANQFNISLSALGIPAAMVAGDNDPSATQVEEAIRLIRTNGIDTIIGSLDVKGLAKIVSAVRQRGLNIKVIVSSSEAPSQDLLAQYGSQLAGMTTVTNYLPLEVESPANTAYRKAMSAYAPESRDSGQTLALLGYLIGDIFVRGLQEAGACPTRQGFIDGLRAVKDYDAGGLLNKIDFEADFGKAEECYSFIQVNSTGTGMEVVNTNFCGSRLN
ncbi:ABC transporter substrate-binding protein [Frankia sp. R43]|nr:ABC transporter substrate-binding protein [Frankia sp. R43]